MDNSIDIYDIINFIVEKNVCFENIKKLNASKVDNFSFSTENCFENLVEISLDNCNLTEFN